MAPTILSERTPIPDRVENTAKGERTQFADITTTTRRQGHTPLEGVDTSPAGPRFVVDQAYAGPANQVPARTVQSAAPTRPGTCPHTADPVDVVSSRRATWPASSRPRGGGTKVHAVVVVFDVHPGKASLGRGGRRNRRGRVAHHARDDPTLDSLEPLGLEQNTRYFSFRARCP